MNADWAENARTNWRIKKRVKYPLGTATVNNDDTDHEAIRTWKFNKNKPCSTCSAFSNKKGFILWLILDTTQMNWIPQILPAFTISVLLTFYTKWLLKYKFKNHFTSMVFFLPNLSDSCPIHKHPMTIPRKKIIWRIDRRFARSQTKLKSSWKNSNVRPHE